MLLAPIITIKLDKAGLPLIPQPTDSPYDPLNYPKWLKCITLLLVSVVAFLVLGNLAIINSAVVPLSNEFHISPHAGTYQSAVALGASSLGPLILTPFADIYGRRGVYLFAIFTGFASALGSAYAKSYGTLILARTFNGFGPTAAVVIGSGTVVDLFYVNQRGKAMGFFQVVLTNGAHLAPMIGGYVARSKGWRWCFLLGAILNGAFFMVCLFLLPETLFGRPSHDTIHVSSEPEEKGHSKNGDKNCDLVETLHQGGRTSNKRTVTGSKIHIPPPFTQQVYLHGLRFGNTQAPYAKAFKPSYFILRPLSMLRYPSVIFPVLYNGIAFSLGSIGPALIVATIFSELYAFGPVQNGLSTGISLTGGALLGELFSGPVTDAMMQRARRISLQKQMQALEKGNDQQSENQELDLTLPAEVRLHAIWTGAVAVPAGLLMFGLGIHYHASFILPCMGMALTGFGSQIVTSVLFSYSCGDCYRERANDVSLCFNFFRQIFGMSLGFYSIPLGEKIGFQWSFTFFALLCIVSFLPIVALMFHGEKWRKRLGVPKAY